VFVGELLICRRVRPSLLSPNNLPNVIAKFTKTTFITRHIIRIIVTSPKIHRHDSQASGRYPALALRGARRAARFWHPVQLLLRWQKPSNSSFGRVVSVFKFCTCFHKMIANSSQGAASFFHQNKGQRS
jgi:hypothetical protein